MNQVMVLTEQHDVAKNPTTDLRIAITTGFFEWHVGQPDEPHLQNQLGELRGQPPQQQEVHALPKEERNASRTEEGKRNHGGSPGQQVRAE